MGLFGGNKTAPDEETAATPAPAPVSEPTVEMSDKKEPLLAKGDSDAPMAVPNPPSGDLESPANAEPSKTEFEEALEKAKVACLTCCDMPRPVKMFLIAAGLSAAVIFGLLRLLAANNGEKNIAFIGNSYFVVNDLPKLLETMGDGKIFQDSCLHGSGSLLNILKTGNGMFYRWNTDNALMDDTTFLTEDGELVELYDYGACSVPQLLLGQDSMLSAGNELGTFLDDGNNPCLNDEYYLEYQASFNYSDPWDFVILADQSKRMSFEETRKDALLALNYTYGPILKDIKATPIVVQTHAFWSNNANMTGLEDVPTFTSMIKEGAEIYNAFLKEKSVRGRIARVGDAFLTVWEEDSDLWETLFLGDYIHPSPKGSFLYACVIYATIYKKMPSKSINEDVMSLFENARKLQTDDADAYPTEEEATYLYKIAKKVALQNYKPKSYKTINQESSYTEDEGDDAAQYGDDAQYAYDQYGDDAAGDDHQGDDAAFYGDDAAQADGNADGEE